jgi:hypothetical protein
MTSRSTLDRLEIFTASATLAAHASFIEQGFRPRDLKFFLELFLNWIEEIDAPSYQVQNTQITRYVEDLVENGFAKGTDRRGVRVFALTRLGVLELLTRLVHSRNATHSSTTLFRICFVRSYRPWLERLVQREGEVFPHSLQLEVAALLDVAALVSSEIKRVERAIARTERRIKDAVETSKLTTNRLASHVPFTEIVEEVEARYPYELNTMKPLRELMASIAPDQRRWEFQEGGIIRVKTLWEPQLALLKELLRRLKQIQASPVSS